MASNGTTTLLANAPNCETPDRTTAAQSAIAPPGAENARRPGMVQHTPASA